MRLRHTPLVLLDDSRLQGAGRSLLLEAEAEVIRADSLDQVSTALAALDEAVAAGKTAAGFIAYETAAAFEPRLRTSLAAPQTPYLYFLLSDNPTWLSGSSVAELLVVARGGSLRAAGLTLKETEALEEWYCRQFAEIGSYIDAGDVYQINLTYGLSAKLEGDSLALYELLRRRQPVAYGAYIDFGDGKILSASPELFMRNQGGVLEARPMKGTAERQLNATYDQAIAQALQSDVKTRAENLMIVDLLRNDLSRVSLPGSVEVPHLFETEAYPSVWQMTSTIRSHARPNLTPSAALAALFPCGSVTGAPKVRAMEIIAQLEARPRGVYCGAIGYFRGVGAAADWCLNVPIRTVVLDAEGMGSLSLGSGLVADSVCEEELSECRLKGRFAQNPANNDRIIPHLIETMRRNPDGSMPRLRWHMDRLRQSASRLGYPLNQAAIDDLLSQHAYQGKGPWRVRLTLDHQGAVALESLPFDAADSKRSVRLGLSSDRIDSSDRARQVKSSDRDIYTRGLARCRAAGVDDAVFFNERDEVVEGCIHSLFLDMGDGHLLTPALSSGALPGVMRAILLETDGQAQEKTLTRTDLVNATQIWCSNAVHGLRPATLDPTVLV